jgi:flagellar basal body-associated protein FliL
MFSQENLPYIIGGLLIAAALYYFFVYKKQQAYKEETKETPAAPVDPVTEMYAEEPYEEELYADHEEDVDPKKNK